MNQRKDHSGKEGRKKASSGGDQKRVRCFVDPELVKQGDATKITAGVFGEFSGCDRTEQSGFHWHRR